MAKYKLLTQDGYVEIGFIVSHVYNDTDAGTMNISVKEMVDKYPEDWQLIEENQGKRPIMTYVILLVMMSLYLYAGLAETNWPLIPATTMGFYLLFKIERNGRNN